MAMPDKSQVVALVRREFPGSSSANLRDDEILDALLSAASSGSAQVLSFLARHNINSGFFLSWRQTKAVEQQAKLLDAALHAARNLHELDVLGDAQSRGIPRDIYSSVINREQETVQLRIRGKDKTDEQIRFEEEKSRIDLENRRLRVRLALDAAKDKSLQEFSILAELQQKLFGAYEQRHQIETSNDPVKEAKLRKLADYIAYLESDFDERVGRDPLPSANEG